MMGQFEKVCKGLEGCVSGGNVCRNKCPYDDLGYEWTECVPSLAADALTLIRQQQERIKELEAARAARVMMLEELEAIYQKKDTHVWPFTTPPYLWMTVNPDVRLTRGFWICWRDIMYSLENGSPFYVRENYGKVWKIWTAEPTDDQRKAVKWE